MARFFNTAGPCNPVDHYMLSPGPRVPDVLRLVDQMHCFGLHAPRQVGKTTSIRALAQALTKEGRYAAVWVSVEQGQPWLHDIGAAESSTVAATSSASMRSVAVASICACGSATSPWGWS